MEFEIQIQAFKPNTKPLSTLKVSWKGTNKSYKTCYFRLRIPHMQFFFNYI